MYTDLKTALTHLKTNLPSRSQRSTPFQLPSLILAPGWCKSAHFWSFFPPFPPSNAMQCSTISKEHTGYKADAFALQFCCLSVQCNAANHQMWQHAPRFSYPSFAPSAPLAFVCNNCKGPRRKIKPHLSLSGEALFYFGAITICNCRC